jgi:hypothetical protein
MKGKKLFSTCFIKFRIALFSSSGRFDSLDNLLGIIKIILDLKESFSLNINKLL